MNDLLYQTYKDPSRVSEWTNIKGKLLSCIHKSNADKPYILVDIDEKDFSLTGEVISEITEDPIWVSETRGGYHLIYEKIPRLAREIYMKIPQTFVKETFPPNKIIEIKKEVMTPLPGILQGGHEVKKVEI